MPRILQNADKYAIEDFKQEARIQMARYGFSVRTLAALAKISQSSLNTKIRHEPQKFSITELRKIVPILHPDPGIMLVLMGYSPQEIRKFKEN